MNHAMTAAISTLAAALAASTAGAQTTSRVDLDSSGAQANVGCVDSSISADGRFVAFTGYATNLVPADTNGQRDVFVRDRVLGTTERVSVDSNGAQANGYSEYGSISADGRFVIFLSAATNLVQGDTNGFVDTFVHDRQLGTTECVSRSTLGAQANNDSYTLASISGDGHFAVFASFASNLAGSDTNTSVDVFLRDRLNNTTERISVTPAGGQGDQGSWTPAISPDGRFVAFLSAATNFGVNDTNNIPDIFLLDRGLNTLVRVSVDTAGNQGTFACYGPALTPDGRYVAFNTRSSFNVGDTNSNYDVYLRDMNALTTEWASPGLGGASPNGDSVWPTLSADGRFIAFRSSSSNLIAGDTNLRTDVYLRDRQLGTSERLSVSTAGFQTGGDSWEPAMTPDGRFVVFSSSGPDLVAGDTNGQEDIFLRDRGVPPPALFCFGDGSAGPCPCGNNGLLGRGCENSAATGGAILGASGVASLASDTLSLASSGELAGVTSVFLQGDVAIAPVNFGDGRRCAGGVLKRLYVHNASGGAVSAPIAGDLSIHARSAALGDVLSAGTPRYYQVYYRDSALGFCPAPQGNSWNISSGVTVIWTW